MASYRTEIKNIPVGHWCTLNDGTRTFYEVVKKSRGVVTVQFKVPEDVSCTHLHTALNKRPFNSLVGERLEWGDDFGPAVVAPYEEEEGSGYCGIGNKAGMDFFMKSLELNAEYNKARALASAKYQKEISLEETNPYDNSSESEDDYDMLSLSAARDRARNPLVSGQQVRDRMKRMIEEENSLNRDKVDEQRKRLRILEGQYDEQRKEQRERLEMRNEEEGEQGERLLRRKVKEDKEGEERDKLMGKEVVKAKDVVKGDVIVYNPPKNPRTVVKKHGAKRNINISTSGRWSESEGSLSITERVAADMPITIFKRAKKNKK